MIITHKKGVREFNEKNLSEIYNYNVCNCYMPWDVSRAVIVCNSGNEGSN